MELKHVIPNMERTFGNLEFAGENKVEQRRINGRMTVVSRIFNLYSDVQRADDIIVVLPASAGEKNFESEEKVKTYQSKNHRRGLQNRYKRIHKLYPVSGRYGESIRRKNLYEISKWNHY